MMVPKVITDAASVDAKNRNGRVRVLSREASSKSERNSPPASLSSSSTNVPATRLERWSNTAQSNCTQVDVAHFRKKTTQTAAWQLKCSHPHR